MPTINTDLIPTINPGSLLDRFVAENTTMPVRWLTATDPVFHEVLNRPLADITLRQLVIAKAVDQVQLRLSFNNLFPFLIAPRLQNGTDQIQLPEAWIWAMHVSMPAKWEKIRLAKIKRVSGSNPATGGTGSDYAGTLRFVFSGQQEGSTTEVSLFQADYLIESALAYQTVRVTVPTSSEETTPISSSEAETVDGFLTFATLDPDVQANQDLFDFVAPPLDTTDADSDGEFDTPATYQVLDESDTDNFTLVGLSHGTGLLVDNAVVPVPPIDASVDNWITAFNYPFDDDATLVSATHPSVSVPAGMFKQFALMAPGGDEPTGDLSGEFFPVYLNRIVRETAADTISFRFSTYNVEAASTAPVEFAKLTLTRSGSDGDRVKIEPIENLFPTHAAGDSEVTDSDLWFQGFGEGHVVLSSLWEGTSTSVDALFDAMDLITDDPAQALFTKASARLSSFGLQSSSQYTPTAGQAAALKGSLDGTTSPSATNRYVVEDDQGLGTAIDFLEEGLDDVADIDRTGYTGGLVHKMVILKITGENFTYDDDVLPRLTLLFGRAPIFGDLWFDGTRVKVFSPGGFWQTL